MDKYKDFKKKVYESVGEENVWKVLSYHLMWGSTPDYSQIAQVDFDGDLSVEKLSTSAFVEGNFFEREW